MSPYKKTVLDNGLRVVGYPMRDRQSLSVGIWANVGSRYETPVNSGISHYLEHMVFKGTRSYTCQEIKESIEGVGGSFNGFTAEELTCYFVKIPCRYLDTALDILSEMVLYPRMKPADIDKERTVILEEIKMYKDQPQSYVYELLDKLMWPGHPLGMSTLGTDKSVGAICRRDLAAYLSEAYTPDNLVVSVAGSFQYDTLVKKISSAFKRSAPRARNQCVPVAGAQVSCRSTVFTKQTEQSHIALGFPGVRRDDPDKYAAVLLHVILGANSSSRLFNEVREKRGLAYEIGTHVKFLKDTGVFVVHAGVDSKKTVSTLRLVFGEFARIRRNAVSQGELKRAKDFYTGQMMLAMEDTLDQMLWMGESTTCLDRIMTLAEVMDKVRAVGAADIRRVAQKLFDVRKANLAVIGPLREEDIDLQRLVAG